MDVEQILKIVLREMKAYGYGWRNDWSDFDGRTLRDQLCRLGEWADLALSGRTEEEYTGGTEFMKQERS